MLKRFPKQVSDDAAVIAATRRRSGLASSRVRSGGFTIIEVLIVLAIAGLIMVIVFLAVPSMQRTGRNNALNSSARSFLAAAHTYSSNNGGTQPTTAALASNVITVGAGGSNQEVAKADAGVVSVAVGGTVITASSPIGTLQLITGTTAICNATATGLSGGATSAKSQAVLYVAEGGNGGLLKCIG